MQVFRSGFGKAITVVVILLLVGVLGTIWYLEGFWAFAVTIPAVSFVSYLIALLYWFPSVEVDQGGVRINNVFRTSYLSWNAIELIDTKYALTLTALGKKYSAWAAPAPGRHTSIFASKDQGAHLPETSYLAGTVRPGDLINTDSGAAAAYIRRLWEKRDPEAQAAVASRLFTNKIVILVVLGVLTLLSL